VGRYRRPVPDAEPASDGLPPVDLELLAFAVGLARRAAATTLKWFANDALVVTAKGDGTPVTEADRAAEALVRSELAAAFPDDSIIGEEEPVRHGTSPRTWIVDPVDGTKAFTRGVPLYATLLALVDAHGPAIGVIVHPALGETVYAGRGRGCWHRVNAPGLAAPDAGAVLDGRRCRVSAVTTLADSYVCTSALGNWDPAARLAVLDAVAGLRTWGDAYGYTLVATGRAEAMVDPQAEHYDVAPMAVILPEAGGVFTDLAGVPRADGGSGVASNGHLHEAVLRLLRP
jgi:histidinol-phosphatase